MAPRKTASKIASASVTTSAATSAVSSAYPSRAPSPTPRAPRQIFRFLDLPPELRLRIYEEVLISDKPLDLDPTNPRQILPRLTLFLTSHQLHAEAYPIFYAQTLRLYPSHYRFHRTKRPLLARLPAHYRAAVTTLELRFGPDWSKPPACQNTLPSLGLADCTNLRTLKIFIELDPSDDIFIGFRGKGANADTYKWFCVDLFLGIVAQVGSLETVEIDAFPGVKREAPLVSVLERKVMEAGLRLIWGPSREWGKEKGRESGGGGGLVSGLEKGMTGLRLGDLAGPRLVEVHG